jgi:hypothetical protein
MVPTAVFNGKISTMKTPLQLDDLNLDATAKTQVAALVQSLLEQAKTESAKYYQADLHAKDLKI